MSRFQYQLGGGKARPKEHRELDPGKGRGQRRTWSSRHKSLSEDIGGRRKYALLIPRREDRGKKEGGPVQAAVFYVEDHGASEG